MYTDITLVLRIWLNIELHFKSIKLYAVEIRTNIKTPPIIPFRIKNYVEEDYFITPNNKSTHS